MLCLDHRIRMPMIKDSFKRIRSELNLSCENKMIMNRKNPYEYIEKQPCFLKPNQINIGLDPATKKKESIQYVPLSTILKALLQHEDVLQLWWKIILVQ